MPTKTLARPPAKPLTSADKLARDAAQAADVRAHDTNPNVVALRAERVRTWSGRLMWIGLGLGLAFTMVNVQVFAAQGHDRGSLPWVAAWLLDPMVSLVLVGILLGESVTSRYKVPAGFWVHLTKWAAMASTYAMNTWASWAVLDADSIVLHSVPPLIVVLAAEAIPQLRERITEAIHQAAIEAPRSTRSVSIDPIGSTSIDPRSTTPIEVPAASIDPIGSTPIDPRSTAPIESEPSIDRPRSTPDASIGSTSIESPRSTPDHTGDLHGSASIEADRAPSIESEQSTDRPAKRSIEELRIELAEAIGSGRLDVEPSAESIRKELRISPLKARRLRDELSGSTPDRVDLHVVEAI